MKFLAMKAVFLVVLFCQVSCARLSPDVPKHFDLTGEWNLVESLSDQPPDPAKIRLEEDRNIARGRQKDVSASASFVVTDFPVVVSNKMWIEQNSDSMGIRYSDGLYRDVSWGEHQRNYWHVHAGWMDGILHIVSKRKGIEGREIYVLGSDSDLTVDVTVDTSGSDIRVKRVFRRK